MEEEELLYWWLKYTFPQAGSGNSDKETVEQSTLCSLSCLQFYTPASSFVSNLSYNFPKLALLTVSPLFSHICSTNVWLSKGIEVYPNLSYPDFSVKLLELFILAENHIYLIKDIHTHLWKTALIFLVNSHWI